MADPCSELSATIAQVALNHASRPGVNGIDDVVKRMAVDFPEINRDEVVRSIVEATTGHAKAIDDVTAKIGDLKREAKNDTALRSQIAQLQNHLTGGTLPGKTALAEPNTPAVIETLRGIRDDLKSKLNQSDPAVQKRIRAQIDNLNEISQRLKDNSYVPPTPKERTPLTAQAEQMAYQRDRLRTQINQKIQAMQPKSLWQKASEPLNSLRTLLVSMNFHAVLRQGGFIVTGNPLRAARAIGPMLRAFGSDQAAHTINEEILNRPNAPLYKKSGLYLAPADHLGPLSAQEESYMSNWAQKVPLVKNSERAYTTFLNKLRADSFDTMSQTLARNGQPTMDESKALSNFINVATGRGSLGSMERAAQPLNSIFFSPRYIASRFQLLFGQPMYGGSGATRKIIAGEYAKYLIGMGTVYALGAAAGGKIEHDPRSTDAGKIRFGDTRLDPLSGIAQTAAFVSREGSGSTKNAAGQISSIRGADVPFGGTNSMDILNRFIRSKLAPVPGAAVDVATGKDESGQPVTAGSLAKQLLVPMSMRDIYGAIVDQGVPKGSALSLIHLFGDGLQTYGGSSAPFAAENSAIKAAAKSGNPLPMSQENKDYRAEKKRNR